MGYLFRVSTGRARNAKWFVSWWPRNFIVAAARNGMIKRHRVPNPPHDTSRRRVPAGPNIRSFSALRTILVICKSCASPKIKFQISSICFVSNQLFGFRFLVFCTAWKWSPEFITREEPGLNAVKAQLDCRAIANICALNDVDAAPPVEVSKRFSQTGRGNFPSSATKWRHAGVRDV